jgi:pSer/pThr/pTyr-binding forkhead associated (FHA) protein
LLEVRDTYINLKDMDSTNGTFFEEERVRAAMLTNGAEFRLALRESCPQLSGEL